MKPRTSFLGSKHSTKRAPLPTEEFFFCSVKIAEVSSRDKMAHGASDCREKGLKELLELCS